MSIFNHKGNDINYIIDGDLKSNKEVIIILNGIMMSANSWEIFKESFSKDNTLIRFDMYDQGFSTKMNYNYTQEIQVELLNDLIEYLELKQVNLVGISYGASVGLQYACKYQEKVKKLVLANGVAKTSKWLKDIGDGWNNVAKTRDGQAYYNITIPYIYSPKFYVSNYEWMENRRKLLVPIFSNEVFLDAMIRLTKSAETHDCVDCLDNLYTNTLIIASEYDYLTPVYEQIYLNDNIKNSKLIVFPNCGHASMYEQPELFASTVLGFVNNSNSEFKL